MLGTSGFFFVKKPDRILSLVLETLPYSGKDIHFQWINCSSEDSEWSDCSKNLRSNLQLFLICKSFSSLVREVFN